MPLHQKGGMDEDFSGRIKNFEDKLRGNSSVDKKPRDLLRAIGKYKIYFLEKKCKLKNKNKILIREFFLMMKINRKN